MISLARRCSWDSAFSCCSFRSRAHQPARGAEQLLIVLEQLLVELAVDAVGQPAVIEQLLRGGDDLLLGRK